MKTIPCERCGKEIEMRWRRKYCNKCRREVDKELQRKYVEKHLVPDELRKRKKAKTTYRSKS
jgi:hypothetical protein